MSSADQKQDFAEVAKRIAAERLANPRPPRPDPTLRRRDIRSMLRWAGPFTVTSFGNGLLEIRPSYTKDCKPPECKVDGSHYCAACECNHVPGFMTRIELARRIEVLLNREARKR